MHAKHREAEAVGGYDIKSQITIEKSQPTVLYSSQQLKANNKSIPLGSLIR